MSALEIYPIDSHPSDGRAKLETDVFPTITEKIKKGSADEPLILIRKKQDDQNLQTNDKPL